MKFEKESKSRNPVIFFRGGGGGGGGGGGFRGVRMRMQGRVQLSCGHVDINMMIIHDDNPNQGYYFF